MKKWKVFATVIKFKSNKVSSMNGSNNDYDIYNDGNDNYEDSN